jgi:hypothetical protein
MPAIGASDPFEMSQLDDEPQYKERGSVHWSRTEKKGVRKGSRQPRK